MRALSLFLLPLLACGADGIQAKGVNDSPDDADGDGFDTESDCDDTNPAVHPGAPEVCNGVDDDCDGLLDTVDDDLRDGVAAFEDGDGDGYGDPDRPVVTCALGEGAVEDASDCDDGAASTHPGAPEQCATVADDDCDGGNNDEGAEGCIPLYADADGDGFGGDDSACLCQPDEAFPAFFAQDCDDGAASVNPDAEEICGNGVDDDCDGTPGACPLMGTLSLDSDGDAAVRGILADAETGAKVLGPGDLDGDGRDDVVVLAPGGGGAVGVVRGAGPATSASMKATDSCWAPTASTAWPRSAMSTAMAPRTLRWGACRRVPGPARSGSGPVRSTARRRPAAHPSVSTARPPGRQESWAGAGTWTETATRTCLSRRRTRGMCSLSAGR